MYHLLNLSPPFITAMSQHLIPKLFREIFTHLDNKHDLSSFCEVSRSFKKTAQPLLLRKFTLMAYSDESQMEVFGGSRVVYSDRTFANRPTEHCSWDENQNWRRSWCWPDLWSACYFVWCLPMFTWWITVLQKLKINQGAKLMYARAILAAMTSPVLLLLSIKLKTLEVLNVSINEWSLIGLVDIRVIWMYLSTPPISHRLLSQGHFRR